MGRKISEVLMPDNESLKDLAQRFAEKNPTLLRDMMESHFVRFTELEISQGKVVKCKCEKNYKELK